MNVPSTVLALITSPPRAFYTSFHQLELAGHMTIICYGTKLILAVLVLQYLTADNMEVADAIRGLARIYTELASCILLLSILLYVSMSL